MATQTAADEFTRAWMALVEEFSERWDCRVKPPLEWHEVRGWTCCVRERVIRFEQPVMFCAGGSDPKSALDIENLAKIIRDYERDPHAFMQEHRAEPEVGDGGL